MLLSNQPTTIVLGAPFFGVSPSWPLSPAGYLPEFEAIASQFGADSSKEFLMEYCGIIDTLNTMGLPFAILGSPDKKISPPVWHCLTEILGVKSFVTLPHLKFCGEMLWPRDLATWLPNGTLLFNPEAIRSATARELAVKVPSKSSYYGEGGRMLLSQDLAVVFSCIYEEIGGTITEDRPQPAPLHELKNEGLTIVSLLGGLHHTKFAKNGRCLWSPGNHLDRFMGLLRGPDGKHHLILDPKMVSGYKDMNQPPIFNAAQTLRNYTNICAAAGIEVHVPSKLSMPLALGFVQFSTGQVLVTGGDKEVASIIAGIVGQENTYCTSVPVQTIPVHSQAGLHCLVSEWPSSILVPL